MKSEDAVTAEIKLKASQEGVRLWRNNVGVAQDDTGRVVRYGLLNDSQRLNQSMKSSDLIGITPTVVTQGMVGKTVGIFTAVECKREGWNYTGTPREIAQKAFVDLVLSLGGIGRFDNGCEI